MRKIFLLMLILISFTSCFSNEKSNVLSECFCGMRSNDFGDKINDKAISIISYGYYEVNGEKKPSTLHLNFIGREYFMRYKINYEDKTIFSNEKLKNKLKFKGNKTKDIFVDLRQISFADYCLNNDTINVVFLSEDNKKMVFTIIDTKTIYNNIVEYIGLDKLEQKYYGTPLNGTSPLHAYFISLEKKYGFEILLDMDIMINEILDHVICGNDLYLDNQKLNENNLKLSVFRKKVKIGSKITYKNKDYIINKEMYDVIQGDISLLGVDAENKFEEFWEIIPN